MAAIVPTRYLPNDGPPVAPSSTDTHKTTDGRDSTPLPLPPRDAVSDDMNRDMNPDAQPFRPDGARELEENRAQNPPPWSASQAPPTPGSLLPFHNASQAYHGYAAQPQAHAYYHQWLQYFNQAYQAGYQGSVQGNYQPAAQSYGASYSQPYYGAPPVFGQQGQMVFPNQANHYATQSPAQTPYRGMNEDVQAPPPPLSNPNSGAASHGQGKHKGIPQGPKAPKVQPPSQKKGRYGDAKIMLPAPEPTQEYLSQATAESTSASSSNRILVILDLNGTVLYRPNKNAKTMIERPFLRPFLRYLFENFSVMVWSSAKPDNVKSLVMQALDKDLQSKLVARWARESFGLSPTNYNQNVQVYKNLKLVWSRDVIQQCHPEYMAGKRFAQHNTLLIDDSALKANAQPYNLLEIPEFSATPEQMEGDVLRAVAGYLEVLRQQADVSQFIRKEPFKDDGRWSFEWPEGAVGGRVEMKPKATTQKKKQKAKKGDKRGANKTPTSLNHEPEDTAAVSSRELVVPTSTLSEKVHGYNLNSLATPLQKY